MTRFLPLLLALLASPAHAEITVAFSPGNAEQAVIGAIGDARRSIHLTAYSFTSRSIVDQALATQVLPDPADRGKDLGIMNIATAVPQAAAPLLGALVVAALGGFAGLFVLSALAAVLGAIAILPIKTVK